MNIAIRYYTRSGNTKKLADAIAETVSVEANAITAPLTEKVDILFLGSSYYAFDADDAVKSFISDNKDNIGKIVCFGTSAMMKSMRKPITKVADKLGVAVADEEFHCRGQFGKVHKGRPNEKDIGDAKKFATHILSSAK
ncbi:MAG: flavodoxin [Clostridia bacterium]|nr:flavodoxin [Clostridia bacterium]